MATAHDHGSGIGASEIALPALRLAMTGVPSHRGSRGASIGLSLLALAAAIALPGSLRAQSYSLAMPSVEVAPGDPFVLPVQGEWLDPVMGFQLSIGFPVTAPVTGLAIGVENTLVGDLAPEFVQFNVSLTQGSIVGGVLFEWIPPFQGIVMPPLGFPIAIAEITGTVTAEAPQEPVAFVFENGLGNPPVNNTFIVEANSIPPEEITDGLLDVRHPPIVIVQEFIRGDVNLDNQIDVSDVIFHLGYTFSGGATPLCLDAGDANDDGHSDISDGIFILTYLFSGGQQPWPPFPTPGTDFTPDPIGCAQGL